MQQKDAYLAPMMVTKVLALIVALLFLVGITGIFYNSMVVLDQNSFTYKVLRGFDLNVENNFPAFFSTVILLLSSLLLFIIYYLKRSSVTGGGKWGVLSLLFLFLAVDENLQIHEQTNEIIRPMLATDLNGFLLWAWVVPYSLLVIAVGVYFFTFLLKLPTKTRNLFLLSGFIFVSGAIGLEVFEGYFFRLYGSGHISITVLCAVEELMEMSGVVIFIYALLDYLSSMQMQLQIGAKGNAANEEEQVRQMRKREMAVLKKDPVRTE